MLDPVMTGVIRFHQGDTLAVCFLSLALTALLLQMSTAPVLVIVANWNAPQVASVIRFTPDRHATELADNLVLECDSLTDWLYSWVNGDLT